MSRRIAWLLLALLCASPLSAQEEEHWQKLFAVNQRFAEAGSKEGQFKLAEMYEEGVGTAADPDKARAWYEKAAAQGHEEARRRLDNWAARQAERSARTRPGAVLPSAAEEAKRKAEEEQAAKRKAEEEQARLAEQKRAEEERARLAAQKKAEEEARRAAAKKAEEEQARLAAQRRAEEERARQAAKQRAEETKAKLGAQPAPPDPAGPPPAATGPAQPPAPAAAPAAATAPAGGDTFESDPCKSAAARFMSTCRK